MYEQTTTESLLILSAILFVYCFPSIIASGRGHHNAAAICVLTIFTGWTGLGWVIALVWACTAVRDIKSPGHQAWTMPEEEKA